VSREERDKDSLTREKKEREKKIKIIK